MIGSYVINFDGGHKIQGIDSLRLITVADNQVDSLLRLRAVLDRRPLLLIGHAVGNGWH